jgi:hypothetical protein
MKYSLLVLPFLASLAAAQDDIWKQLSKGDRVQVTFRSGNTISGQLTNKPADPRIVQEKLDMSALAEITLDVSLEYPGLNGTLSILKSEIKEIRKIRNIDPETEKRIRAEIQRIQQQSAADDQTRRQQEGERDAKAKKDREAAAKLDKAAAEAKNKGATVVKDMEELEKGLQLLKKFPPDKFGPQTAKEVADKSLLKIPVTQDEREFLDAENYRLWSKALDYQKSQDKETKKPDEKKPDEKKPE